MNELPSTAAYTTQLPPTMAHPSSDPPTEVLDKTIKHSPTNTSAAEVPAPSPRVQKLNSQISTLQSQITTTQASLDSTRAKVHSQDPHADPDAIVKEHIRLLHQYNEIKDVGQGLMGLIADARGVRLADIMEEFGVSAED